MRPLVFALCLLPAVLAAGPTVELSSLDDRGAPYPGLGDGDRQPEPGEVSVPYYRVTRTVTETTTAQWSFVAEGPIPGWPSSGYRDAGFITLSPSSSGVVQARHLTFPPETQDGTPLTLTFQATDVTGTTTRVDRTAVSVPRAVTTRAYPGMGSPQLAVSRTTGRWAIADVANQVVHQVDAQSGQVLSSTALQGGVAAPASYFGFNMRVLQFSPGGSLLVSLAGNRFSVLHAASGMWVADFAMSGTVIGFAPISEDEMEVVYMAAGSTRTFARIEMLSGHITSTRSLEELPRAWSFIRPARGPGGVPGVLGIRGSSSSQGVTLGWWSLAEPSLPAGPSWQHPLTQLRDLAVEPETGTLLVADASRLVAIDVAGNLLGEEKTGAYPVVEVSSVGSAIGDRWVRLGIQSKAVPFRLRADPWVIYGAETSAQASIPSLPGGMIALGTGRAVVARPITGGQELVGLDAALPESLPASGSPMAVPRFDSWVVDDLAGDGDGKIRGGDEVILAATFVNRGQAAIDGLSATLELVGDGGTVAALASSPVSIPAGGRTAGVARSGLRVDPGQKTDLWVRIRWTSATARGAFVIPIPIEGFARGRVLARAIQGFGASSTGEHVAMLDADRARGFVVDSTSGRVRWEFPIGTGTHAGLPTTAGVDCVSDDGSVVWARNASNPTGLFRVTREGVVAFPWGLDRVVVDDGVHAWVVTASALERRESAQLGAAGSVGVPGINKVKRLLDGRLATWVGTDSVPGVIVEPTTLATSPLPAWWSYRGVELPERGEFHDLRHASATGPLSWVVLDLGSGATLAEIPLAPKASQWGHEMGLARDPSGQQLAVGFEVSDVTLAQGGKLRWLLLDPVGRRVVNEELLGLPEAMAITASNSRYLFQRLLKPNVGFVLLNLTAIGKLSLRNDTRDTLACYWLAAGARVSLDAGAILEPMLSWRRSLDGEPSGPFPGESLDLVPTAVWNGEELRALRYALEVLEGPLVIEGTAVFDGPWIAPGNADPGQKGFRVMIPAGTPFGTPFRVALRVTAGEGVSRRLEMEGRVAAVPREMPTMWGTLPWVGDPSRPRIYHVYGYQLRGVDVSTGTWLESLEHGVYEGRVSIDPSGRWMVLQNRKTAIVDLESWRVVDLRAEEEGMTTNALIDPAGDVHTSTNWREASGWQAHPRRNLGIGVFPLMDEVLAQGFPDGTARWSYRWNTVVRDPLGSWSAGAHPVNAASVVLPDGSLRWWTESGLLVGALDEDGTPEARMLASGGEKTLVSLRAGVVNRKDEAGALWRQVVDLATGWPLSPWLPPPGSSSSIRVVGHGGGGAVILGVKSGVSAVLGAGSLPSGPVPAARKVPDVGPAVGAVTGVPLRPTITGVLGVASPELVSGSGSMTVAAGSPPEITFSTPGAKRVRWTDSVGGHADHQEVLVADGEPPRWNVTQLDAWGLQRPSVAGSVRMRLERSGPAEVRATVRVDGSSSVNYTFTPGEVSRVIEVFRPLTQAVRSDTTTNVAIVPAAPYLAGPGFSVLLRPFPTSWPEYAAFVQSRTSGTVDPVAPAPGDDRSHLMRFALAADSTMFREGPELLLRQVEANRWSLRIYRQVGGGGLEWRTEYRTSNGDWASITPVSQSSWVSFSFNQFESWTTEYIIPPGTDPLLLRIRATLPP